MPTSFSSWAHSFSLFRPFWLGRFQKFGFLCSFNTCTTSVKPFWIILSSKMNSFHWKISRNHHFISFLTTNKKGKWCWLVENYLPHYFLARAAGLKTTFTKRKTDHYIFWSETNQKVRDFFFKRAREGLMAIRHKTVILQIAYW